MAELAAPSHAQTTDVLALLQADGLPSLNRQLVGWGEAVLGLQGLQLQRCHDGPAACGCSRTVALQDTEGAALGRLCADRPRRAALGAAGRARLDAEFLPAAMAAAHLDLYLRLSDADSPASG